MRTQTLLVPAVACSRARIAVQISLVFSTAACRQATWLSKLKANTRPPRQRTCSTPSATVPSSKNFLFFVNTMFVESWADIALECPPPVPLLRCEAARPKVLEFKLPKVPPHRQVRGQRAHPKSGPPAHPAPSLRTRSNPARTPTRPIE